jgi:hypothetical protein
MSRYFAIQRPDGKFFSHHTPVGPKWVSTASQATLFWGHDGDALVKTLRIEYAMCALVPADVTVRAENSLKGKPQPGNSNVTVRPGKPKKVWTCVNCSVDPSCPGYPGTSVREVHVPGQGVRMFCNGCNGEDLALV